MWLSSPSAARWTSTRRPARRARGGAHRTTQCPGRTLDRFSALLTKELSLIGSHAYGSNRRGPEFVAAADILSRYSAELAGLQTHQFPLDDVQAAFELASNKISGAVKATIVQG